MKLAILFATLAVGILSAVATPISVDWSKCSIILPDHADPVKRLAAAELQKHLALITGKTPPVLTHPRQDDYPFFVGTAIPGDARALAPEEGRWDIQRSGTWLWGDDDAPGNAEDAVFHRSARTGTLFAVYDFLEKNFHVLHLSPGDRGIVHPVSPDALLTPGHGSWLPGQLRQRGFRNIIWQHNAAQKELPPELRWSEDRLAAYKRDVDLWLKRHRMGSSIDLRYGHAFTDWFVRYGKTHPEYFAMQPDGKRRPEFPASPETVKLCVSNPVVAEQLVADWTRLSPRPKSINCCENDSLGFCVCPECRALDVALPGDAPHEHLTDRYLAFANRVQRLAAAVDPEASAVMYAYSAYLQPPRREKADPRLIVGFVPSLLDLGKKDSIYDEWRNAGLKHSFWRPNDPHLNTGLPMGFEKRMFDNFQLGIRSGIIATDYDCMHNFWPATGIADYILVRAHLDPSKPFEYWEEEYCSAFGAAAEDVKSFFRYWRKYIFEERVMPQAEKFRKLGINDNFRRGLLNNIGLCFKRSDFDNTDAILERASNRQLTAPERARLEELRLGNRHSRLTFTALNAADTEKLAAGRALLDFRRTHADELNFDWVFLALQEKQYGDCTGIQAALLLKDYDRFQPLQLQWMFRIDPERVGETGQWEKLPYHRMLKWSPILTNAPWERQTFQWMAQELREQLRTYDGIGYYALQITIPPAWRDGEIALFFGAVDESCKLYVNGTPAGERKFSHPDDWKRPFAIRIDPLLNPAQAEQIIVVRVEDTAGDGGIWKPVYLVGKTPAVTP